VIYYIKSLISLIINGQFKSIGHRGFDFPDLCTCSMLLTSPLMIKDTFRYMEQSNTKLNVKLFCVCVCVCVCEREREREREREDNILFCLVLYQCYCSDYPYMICLYSSIGRNLSNHFSPTTRTLIYIYIYIWKYPAISWTSINLFHIFYFIKIKINEPINFKNKIKI